MWARIEPEAQRFKKSGLTSIVLPRDDVEARSELQLLSLPEAFVVPNFDLCYAHVGEPGVPDLEYRVLVEARWAEHVRRERKLYPGPFREVREKWGAPCRARINVKSDGQECPSHTSSGSAEQDQCHPS